MGKTILFQGDSITDTGRREASTDFLGKGYVHKIADILAARDASVQVINRGISGNRVVDLVARWQEDCIDLNPDVLTILIGINDCWRKYDSNDPTPVEAFEANYDAILTQVRAKTKATIFLMEPYVLPVPADRLQWRETLDPQIQAVRRLAKKHRTHLIPLDAIFAIAAIDCDYTDLTVDGVHPTDAGHELICREWLRAYDAL
ncbi:SGNH/GDSL hydrolase family protein [Ruminococcaceae bacterium OttesenSCG-928-L11]|nr:SGNH/GDSL hydrolase family protein [Ruminococcaceae bacterium OttesenSCG-928-L11]